MPDIIAIRSARDVAELVGCSRRAVVHARQSGRLSAEYFVRRHGRWYLRADCFDQCVDTMLALYRHGSQSRTQPATESAYSVARARRMRFQAELARLQLEKFEAELLPTHAVVKWYTDAVQRTSTRVLQVPRRLSQALVGQDAGTIEELLETALRATLRELKSEFAEGVPAMPERVHGSESVF